MTEYRALSPVPALGIEGPPMAVWGLRRGTQRRWCPILESTVSWTEKNAATTELNLDHHRRRNAL